MMLLQTSQAESTLKDALNSLQETYAALPN